ncbi:MAG: EamA family transporter [Deltaproteobacteria bacterium]|nr:EamA family transporter [Deltaproteobacteria bacterium]
MRNTQYVEPLKLGPEHHGCGCKYLPAGLIWTFEPTAQPMSLLAEITAIISAMGWATDSVLVRQGLRRSNIFAAMLVSFGVSITIMWTYLFATTSLEFLSSPAIIYYLISGCMQPLMARALFYEGITRIGVARAGPLRGIEPLFATIIGVAFLHEQPGAWVYLGTTLIMGSLWLISGKQQGDAKWRLIDTAFPMSAALISAISQSLRKQGLKILPDPFVAVAVVTTVSLIFFWYLCWPAGEPLCCVWNARVFLFFSARQ